MRLGAHMLEQSKPGGGAEYSRAFGCALVHVHNGHAPNANAFHRFEIGGDAIAGDITVEPEPEDPRARRVGRREEFLFQI